MAPKIGGTALLLELVLALTITDLCADNDHMQDKQYMK